MLQDYVAKRISSLRTTKGVSARDMSLGLGMSENYINSVENGKLSPSLVVLEYICEYLNITIKDFFDNEKSTPYSQNELIALTEGLQHTQIESLKEIARGFQALNKHY